MLADVMLGKEEASEVVAVHKTKQLGTVERNFYAAYRQRNVHGSRGLIAMKSQIAAWLDPAFQAFMQEQFFEVGIGKATAQWCRCFSVCRMVVNKPEGARWLEGFARLQPEDVSPDTAINFDTASTLYLP